MWLKIKQLGLRRFWPMLPLARVPFWYRFIELQPYLVVFPQLEEERRVDLLSPFRFKRAQQNMEKPTQPCFRNLLGDRTLSSSPEIVPLFIFVAF